MEPTLEQQKKKPIPGMPTSPGIAAISDQQRADRWAERQASAKRQEAEAEHQRIEKFRTQRIAQIKSQLDGIPARHKAADMKQAEADDLAGIFSRQLDSLSAKFAQDVHASVHGGRAVSLDLGSPEAQAFFFGDVFKKGIPRLAQIATTRNLGAPVADQETLVAELKAEEKKLRTELAELQIKG